MILFFAGFMLLALTVALADWRRGWLLALIVAVLQDPVRKMTAGTPVALTMSVVLVYFVVLFGAQRQLQQGFLEFTRRIQRVSNAMALMFFFILLAALNGLFTYGAQYWKVPALSLFIYCAPLPAVILGFIYAQREEHIVDFLRFYAVVTTVALIGTPLEYLGFQHPAIGLVGMPESYVRHLPGLQIKVLSGFYRAPDIMGWHAATLASVGVIMALRNRVLTKAWPWLLVASWGFFNTLISGRRKAIYMFVIFAAVLVWRYFRRLQFAQVMSFGLGLLLIFGVMRYTASTERGSVYAQGAATTREEVLDRLEGGFITTIQMYGIMGAGLGTATQGVRHLLGRDENVGWQEGGLGKLAIEVGVPGVLAAGLLAWVLFRTLLRITAAPDLPGSSQLMRVSLFAMFVTNVVQFMVSAQAYSDAVLTLLTAFFLGFLFATGVLDERHAAQQQAAAAPDAPGLTPATATA